MVIAAKINSKTKLKPVSCSNLKNQPKNNTPIVRQVVMKTIKAALRAFNGIESLITVITPTKATSITDIVENSP